MTHKERNARREFLKKIIATSALAGLIPYIDPVEILASSYYGVLPKRPLGKTGYNVGLYSLGGQGTLEIPGKEKESVEIINRAIDLGINYIDTSAYYGRSVEGQDQLALQGTSERYIGKVLKDRRKEVFIATKTHDRSYDGAMRHLEKSIKNLQTDVIDLWQIHNVRSAEKETLDRIFADNGVIKAMEKAKNEGTVRFLGITGHEDPEVLDMLTDRYPFDNVLMAINAADKHHNSFIEQFLPVAVEKKMGIVGMKIPARDRIFDKGGIITMKEAMEYVLTLPVSTIIIGIDKIPELEENIKIASEFKPLSADELLAIEEKVKPHYEHLQFFKGLSDWPADW
ncbi:MAG: aldo/keto reductase [Bacteroidales bacterium]|nr:MAG: aldo/keto reductase [Bacteroidales bacterium]